MSKTLISYVLQIPREKMMQPYFIISNLGPIYKLTSLNFFDYRFTQKKVALYETV